MSRSPSTNEYVEIRLSTTSKTTDDLSSFFAENIGDDETLVYSGELIFSTDGSGPVGGPKDFDYIVEFDEPFIYDPTAGNLLYEFRHAKRRHYGWQQDSRHFHLQQAGGGCRAPQVAGMRRTVRL